MKFIKEQQSKYAAWPKGSCVFEGDCESLLVQLPDNCSAAVSPRRPTGDCETTVMRNKLGRRVRYGIT